MSYFYQKDGAVWVPEAINPDLVKIAKAIIKTCRLTFKHQMKTNALNNAIKGTDKDQLAATMFKCIEKNKALYNQDMSLTGVKIVETDDAFFADKDADFYKKQIQVLIDFAAINTVVESKMMPLMSEACKKTLDTPLNKILFFTNQTEILADDDDEEEDAE